MSERPAADIHGYLITLCQDPFSASTVWGTMIIIKLNISTTPISGHQIIGKKGSLKLWKQFSKVGKSFALEKLSCQHLGQITCSFREIIFFTAFDFSILALQFSEPSAHLSSDAVAVATVPPQELSDLTLITSTIV